MNIRIIFEIEENCQTGGDNLTDYRCDGCACDAELRRPAQTENQNRIKNNIDDGTQSLCTHGKNCAAGRLQNALKGHLYKQTKGKNCADFHVGHTVRNNFRIIRLRTEKQTACEQTEQQEYQIAANCKKHTVSRRMICLLLLLRAQRPRQQRIHTDAGTRCDSNHQILHRKRQRNRRQRVLTDACHENTVHDVIQRHDQHGYNHWQCHRDEQLIDRHNAHLVFFLHLCHKQTPFCFWKERR